MAHLELRPKLRVSSFRKLAVGSWETAYDPTVYGTLTVRMDRALAYMEAFRRSTGLELTVTHLVLKALAQALRRCPDANAVLRFHRIYLRQRITVSALLRTDGGPGEWAPVRVEDADQKGLRDIVQVLEAGRGASATPRVGRWLEWIPTPLVGLFTRCVSFLAVTLNLDLGRFGLPRDAFGAAIVTDVGALGLDGAYLPLVPFTRVPVFLAPGAVRDTPVVEDGRVVVGKVMSLNASIDHRFIDGFHAGVLATALKELLEDPEAAFGPPGAAASVG
ncbi:2-oxo acid dehydrogenase acyltransferase catalytic subunit [Myxococcus stipitatus DSM 14675]|uniref:2-oxo acid dehydrogenase acyltransferase catalytic subunit n=1 Tax=Myxococcus stipitatus (strain DSM 14675 / JCM 12634 / Mx s8) TaxID=1278073 RepID=L7UFX0_MYXSD|nr:2-oxo acid dehydrogenase subunit E2 [Myxococcus stipitatus]AGC46790.1 2-oxo acid dehydrogenase acyltransferase catalytic subunit [Myxococcus stipitatus DSM 14675]